MTETLYAAGMAVRGFRLSKKILLTRLTTGVGLDGCDGCLGTAHSSSPSEANLNGILKGIAAWHLWDRLAGWDGH